MGKTAFTRGLARGLGCRRTRHQPHVHHRQRIRAAQRRCFTLICTAWAASTSCSTSAGRTISTRGGVCAVEWSERVDDALPADTIWVRHRPAARAESGRIITITGGESTVKILASGDLRQERVRAPCRKTARCWPQAYQDTGLTHSRDADAAGGRNAEKRGADAGRYGRHRRGRGAGRALPGMRIGVAAAKGLAWAADDALLRRIHAGGHGAERRALRRASSSALWTHAAQQVYNARVSTAKRRRSRA